MLQIKYTELNVTLYRVVMNTDTHRHLFILIMYLTTIKMSAETYTCTFDNVSYITDHTCVSNKLL